MDDERCLCRSMYVAPNTPGIRRTVLTVIRPDCVSDDYDV